MSDSIEDALNLAGCSKGLGTDYRSLKRGPVDDQLRKAQERASHWECEYWSLRHELEGWRLRAQKTEAALNRTPEENMAIVDRAVKKVVRKHHLDEQGPGIVQLRPDNSIVWLDEDLLCDDA